ncbi:protein of unknown function [Methylorubrum extorquens DM4]|uniref:Uncharacterized protein n=1 Tax=Methylorubrum extorquens (strain DSM 6343 / CIP 106787 / DM4) TaxID=661410 RepID=C7C7Y6_METED|nr:protein of unknown function [Methylorubrum extorquens DM4]
MKDGQVAPQRQTVDAMPATHMAEHVRGGVVAVLLQLMGQPGQLMGQAFFLENLRDCRVHNLPARVGHASSSACEDALRSGISP